MGTNDQKSNTAQDTETQAPNNESQGVTDQSAQDTGTQDLTSNVQSTDDSASGTDSQQGDAQAQDLPSDKPADKPAVDTAAQAPVDSSAPADAGASGSVVDQQETPAAHATPASLADSESLAKLQEFAASGTPMLKSIVQNLVTYMDRMAPKKPQTNDTVSRNQQLLYHTLTNLINGLDDEFHKAWSLLLGVFREHGVEGKVFHEIYAFRGEEHVALSAAQRMTLRSLVVLLNFTADPASRKQAMKVIDLDRALKTGITEAGRNRVSNFYGV